MHGIRGKQLFSARHIVTNERTYAYEGIIITAKVQKTDKIFFESIIQQMVWRPQFYDCFNVYAKSGFTPKECKQFT